LGSGPLFPGLVCPTSRHVGSSRPVSSHGSGPDTATASIQEHQNIWIICMNNKTVKSPFMVSQETVNFDIKLRKT
jgi:hypothetical protein